MIALPTIRSKAVMIAIALAAISLAGEASTSAAFAQKSTFQRTKPHVNVGTIGHVITQGKGALTTKTPTVVDPDGETPEHGAVDRRRFFLPVVRQHAVPPHHRPRIHILQR